VDDDLQEASPHPCVITTGDPVSADPFYDVIEVADLTVQVIDNEHVPQETGITIYENELLAYMREALPANVLEVLLIDITPTGTIATIRLPDGSVGTATLNITLQDGLLNIS